MVDRLAAYEDTGLSPTDIAALTARAEAAEARADAAVEDMTAVLKRDSDDICAYCKNRVECESQQCEKYSSGVGDVDGNYPDWKWTCMDFAYGTCSLLADTPCNGCFDDDCKGFEWRGQPANEPLTLEELSKMSDTDWVWVMFPELAPEESGWHRAKRLYDTYSKSHYGKTWFAYRRKPEGSENDAE